MGRIWLLPLLLLFWVCGANAAEACSCAPRSARCGPPGEFWRSTAVFAGRVTAVERFTDASHRSTAQRRVRVRLLQRFRGTVSPANGEALLFTTPVCGYPFKTGQEYLIYAGLREDGRLTATVCSRTMLLERAAIDLAYAQAASVGSTPPGQIVGHVRQVQEHGSRARMLSGLAVVLTGHGVRLTAPTDVRGRYVIDLPGVGVFTLKPELPDTQYWPLAERQIEVPDPRACVEANIDVRSNGHILGRVTDSAGRGVAGLTVSHVGSLQPGRAQPERTRALTSDDGTFRIEKLAPGPFLVGVELPDEDAAAAGVDAASPKPIALSGTLAPGERLSVAALVLPPSVPVVRLQGTVHTADGAPAQGARVFLKSGADDGHILGEPAVADALGRFVLAAIEGQQYVVFADRQPGTSATSRPEFSLPVALNAIPDGPPLRLTVRRRF